MSEKNFSELAIKSAVGGQKIFCKFLSANDTGKTGGHQAGIYIAKNSSEILFDKKFERGKNISRFVKILWQNEIETESRFIYYGAKTRNEYRITNCGNKNFNPLDEQNTGALLVMVQKNFENYDGWILNTDSEIENFLNYFDLSPTETGKLIDKKIFPEVRIETEISKFISSLETDFPSAEIMSKVARDIHEKIFNHSENIIKNPDGKLLQWIETEYDMFRKIEESRYGEKIFHGFDSMQEFIDVANSILNRRKSRAGKSFENQLAAIFDGNNLKYDSQAVTEGNKRPDFIFPSKAAYHDKNFSVDKLIILSAKTTCKDRWRQILNEANRVRDRGNFFYNICGGKNLEEIFLFDCEKKYSVAEIKNLGLNRSEENLQKLLEIFPTVTDIEVKREIVSSIGRQNNNQKIFDFIKNNVYNCGFMDLVYQMYRTCLYKGKTDENFYNLGEEIKNFFDNEVLNKMSDYFFYKQTHSTKKIHEKIYSKPILLRGNNVETLKKIEKNSVQLIFTSPPYYNAKIYSNYHSYKDYLSDMFQTLKICHEVLEDGRFIIINVSPVISKRPGREFESFRYPIHFDFHKILTDAGFYFVDEIQWIKPESSVKNRNGGYQQTKMPLSYKPNCINESILVYRKNAPFLLDKNIAMYDKNFANDEKFDSSNCWHIAPTANKNHPAVFPKELCRKILKYYSFRGDVVLDPFAGSGTFGEVAIEMKRVPILCEQNEKYCDLINGGNIYVQL